MIIRKAQIEELGNVAKQNFENEMVKHLAEFSPPLFKTLNEEQAREAVKFGIAKAEDYGFTLRGPIRLYLELMILFGSHFDTDPQYPWANEILRDKHSILEMERADWLYEKILDYQKNVAGPRGANSRKALDEVLVLAQKPVTISENEFVPEARRELTHAFPEKAKYIGQKSLDALIHKGSAEARKYGFPTVRGDGLMVVLMYAFGHGCADDLLYPWIKRTLTNEKIVDVNARAERLEKKAITWLKHVLNLPVEGE